MHLGLCTSQPYKLWDSDPIYVADVYKMPMRPKHMYYIAMLNDCFKLNVYHPLCLYLRLQMSLMTWLYVLLSNYLKYYLESACLLYFFFFNKLSSIVLFAYVYFNILIFFILLLYFLLNYLFNNIKMYIYYCYLLL